MIHTMDKRFDILCKTVYECGLMAKENQKKVHRVIKEDGTPLTESDLAVTKALNECITKNWPDCNCVSEEVKENSIRDNAPYTFVFDPIDGTDAYSQGMPSWCIGVGVLDKDRKPCAGVLFAPCMDLFITSSFDDDNVYLNGELIKAFEHENEPKQMTIGSNVLKNVDISAYSGKIRSFGSSLIHIVAPLVWSKIDCVLSPKCYVWDICASHVFASKLGFETRYIDGTEFKYSDDILIERRQTKCSVAMGNSGCVRWMIDNFKEKNYCGE